jgi:hypothetical protein
MELTPGRRDLKEPNAEENRTEPGRREIGGSVDALWCFNSTCMVGPPIKQTENSLTLEASHVCVRR